MENYISHEPLTVSCCEQAAAWHRQYVWVCWVLPGCKLLTVTQANTPMGCQATDTSARDPSVQDDPVLMESNSGEHDVYKMLVFIIK